MTQDLTGRIWLIAVFVAASTTQGRASIIYDYDFTYTETAGPFQDFSFSFDSSGLIDPCYVSAGSCGVTNTLFTPFAIEDGVNSWALTQGSIVFNAPANNFPAEGLFCFGTSGAALSNPNFCGAGFSPPNGFLEIALNNGFPSEPGTYTSEPGVIAPGFVGQFFTPFGILEDISSGDVFHQTGTLTVTITATGAPEPDFF